MSKELATHCPQCKRPLQEHSDRLLGVCAEPKCRGPYLRKIKLESYAKRRTWRANFSKEVLERFPDSGNIDSPSGEMLPCDADPIVMVVPTFDRDITELPEQRKQLFIDHLNAILDEAADIVAASRKLDNLQTEFSHRMNDNLSPSSAIVIHGCSTCRGYCCQHGGNTAFLTPGFLAWQMLNRQATVDSLRHQYVSHLPEESVEDSCVFHSSQGCLIPRNDRDEICNTFHCEGLMDAFEHFDQVPKVYSIAIAADGDQATRVGLMDTNGTRQVKSL